MARNRLTLLEIVQRSLSAMNHGNVNSISDTVESRQIADEARVVYYELMDRDDWPHLIKLLPLEALADITRPNFMKIQEDVVRIDDIRYEVTRDDETARRFDSIQYLTPRDFLDMLYLRNSSEANIQTVLTHQSVPLFVRNDYRPTYWTTFDDEHIVFDAYDSEVSDTLLAAKSLALVKQIPPWETSNGFIPDMPDQMFSAFVAEVTASAFTYWKQGQSIKDEQRAARGISRLRKDARKITGQRSTTNYGKPRPRNYVRSEDGIKGSIRDSLSR